MVTRAGSWLSWSVLGGLGAALALQPLGCGTSDDEPADERFIADVLAEVGPRVVEPALDAFLVEARDLEAVTVSWRDAQAHAKPAAKEQARAAFIDAMRAWQRVEGLQIGPLAPALTAVEGGDGRDEIYSWPTVNPCRVDQETVRADWDQPDYFDVTLINAKGLDALEHLLWAGEDNLCSGQIDINADGTWQALGPEGVEANRAALAAAIATELTAVADEQHAAWAGGFSADLAAAGESGSSYETATSGLNAVYDALYYLETTTKDDKLATPLGLRDCTEGCATLAEGGHADDSHTWIGANLDGFEALFTGGGAFGVDDLLRERGHSDLADGILNDLEGARDALAQVDGPIHEAAVTDTDDVRALHDAIKAVTDALKGDVATVLSMSLPSEAGGDAD